MSGKTKEAKVLLDSAESVSSPQTFSERGRSRFLLERNGQKTARNHGFIWSVSVCQPRAWLKCEPGLR